jgi:hypothetical protein
MTSLDELLKANGIALKDTKPGRYYTTCPKCSKDRKNKAAKCLGVNVERDGANWGCNHCLWTGPEKGSGERRSNNELVFYDYVDADGALLFQKVRNPLGREPRFWCRRPNGRGGWISDTKGIKGKPLYRWPQIAAAIAEDREIAIVEGEKDADNLWHIGIPATCNFDGTSDVIKNPKAKPKWKAEYSEALRGARVIAFNDNDAPGYAHADNICKLSLGVAKRVRRLDLKIDWPEIPKGGDVSDWLEIGGGHTPEKLKELIDSAPDYVPADTAKPASLSKQQVTAIRRAMTTPRSSGSPSFRCLNTSASARRRPKSSTCDHRSSTGWSGRSAPSSASMAMTASKVAPSNYRSRRPGRRASMAPSYSTPWPPRSAALSSCPITRAIPERCGPRTRIC